MMLGWIVKCKNCSSTGKFIDIGGIIKECDKCEYRRKLLNFLFTLKRWFFNNPFKSTPVAITLAAFTLMLVAYFLCPNRISLGILITLFGTIFVALKYRLDQASYHKDIFEQRYEIFFKIDEILSDFFRNLPESNNCNELSQKLDSVYRKSYFLFGKETYQFIEKFRKAVIKVSVIYNSGSQDDIAKVKEDYEFLSNLLNGQNLAKNFLELKIDTY